MEVTLAAMLVDAADEEVNEENLMNTLTAAGFSSPSRSQVKAVVAALENTNISSLYEDPVDPEVDAGDDAADSGGDLASADLGSDDSVHVDTDSPDVDAMLAANTDDDDDSPDTADHGDKNGESDSSNGLFDQGDSDDTSDDDSGAFDTDDSAGSDSGEDADTETTDNDGENESENDSDADDDADSAPGDEDGDEDGDEGEQEDAGSE